MDTWFHALALFEAFVLITLILTLLLWGRP
jgi:hypothetical protein